MRLCFVAHSNAHFTHRYVAHFAGRGHEVHLISCYPLDVAGATNHHPAGPDFDPEKAQFIYFRLMRRVGRMIRDIKPDLVHALYVTSNGLMAAASGFHPLVVSALGTDIHEGLRHPLKRHIVRYVLKRCDLVNAVSRELARKVQSAGVPPERIFRATEGIDVPRFRTSRTPLREGTLRILCTRKLYPVYQCPMIVEALVQLAQDGVPFTAVFAAGGPDEPAMRQRVEAAGLADRVEFRGGFTPDELPRLLAEADVYVSASLWDGSSPALLEAMAAGLLPVVSDIPANREWLDEDDALWFPTDDPSRLVAALRRALHEPELRRRAAEALPAKVAAEGDQATNLGRLEEAYLRLVEKRGSRAGRRVPVTGGTTQ